MRFPEFPILSGLAGVALLLVLSGTSLRAQSDGPKPLSDSKASVSDTKGQADSANINRLLSDAKWRSALAEYDAETLVTYTYGNTPWQAHAAELRSIAEHVNSLGKVVNELIAAKGEASPWQQTAIDRIVPLLNDMAKNLNATIKQLRDHQERVQSTEYRDYLRTNAELASRTATTIADFVEYSRVGQQTEAMEKRLELPPKQ